MFYTTKCYHLTKVLYKTHRMTLWIVLLFDEDYEMQLKCLKMLVSGPRLEIIM